MRPGGQNCFRSINLPKKYSAHAGEAPNHPAQVDHKFIISAAGHSQRFGQKSYYWCRVRAAATPKKQTMRTTTWSNLQQQPAVQYERRSNDDDFLPHSSSPGEALESSSQMEQDGEHKNFFDCDSSSSSINDDDDTGGNDLDDSDDDDDDEILEGTEGDLDDAFTESPSFGSQTMDKLKRFVDDDNSTNDYSNVSDRLADVQRAGRTQGVTSAANTTSNVAAQ
jgi:hypothetical protein